MLASDIIGKARILLSDAGKVRWPDPEMLGWLNSAQLQIVVVRPDALSAKADLSLVAGVEQTLPAGALRLLDIIRNVSGRGITLVNRDRLTALNRTWFVQAQQDVIKHFTFDNNDPRSFHVFPPASTAAKVRVLYAARPSDCATLASTLGVDDTFEGPLIDFICYRAWAKDGDSAADSQRSANALQAFMTSLTGKTQADAAATPR